MSSNSFNYKTESNRYNYYYRRLKVFYQKPVAQVSSAVLFSLVTILFFALFAIRPTLITIGELLKKIEDQKKVLERAERKSTSLATAQDLYNQISNDIYVLDQSIPSDYQIQELLLSIESISGNLGIPINNLSVNKIEYPTRVKKSGSIEEINFSISFDASYPNAKSLIANLGQLPRLTSLDSITFGQSDDTRKNVNTSTDIITTNLNCRVFYSPEDMQ